MRHRYRLFKEKVVQRTLDWKVLCRTRNGALKNPILKVLWDTFIGSLKNSLSKCFFKEPWFERFFEEPEMVLPWHHSEEPFLVPYGISMFLCVVLLRFIRPAGEIPPHTGLRCPVGSTDGRATDTRVQDSCSSRMLPLSHACLAPFHLPFTGEHQQCASVASPRVAEDSVLTALDVHGAGGVVLSQRVLHHTRIIPRILQLCSVDLDSGVFPAGDNTRSAESGEETAWKHNK